MPTITKLFIGGPLDGQLLAVTKDTPIYAYEQPSLVDFEAMCSCKLESKLFVQVTYKPMVVSGLDKNHQVMVAAGMTVDEVLEKLIRGYKP